MEWNNLVAMFFDQAERHGERPFLWAKHDGAYHPLTWREVADRVVALARGLKRLGVHRGDRIVLVSENRPEWMIADLAIMAAGGVTVPAYVTNTEEDHAHILDNSGAKGVIVSSARLAETVVQAAHHASGCEFLVAIEPPAVAQQLSLSIDSWDAVVAAAEHGPDNILAESRAFGRDDFACIIYTSGTGGAPKGVVLHHGAILCNCDGAMDMLTELGGDLHDEIYLSFLPLSHAYEHTAGQFLPIAMGAQIYYAEGIDALPTNMQEARPTIMTAVPRLYETMHRRISARQRKATGLKKTLFEQALDLGARKLNDPNSLSIIDRLTDSVVDRLVREKVRAGFGGRLKALVSGGAPLNPEIGTYFTALGLRILQGYGQTEAAPVVSCNRPSHVRIETVGPPLKGVEVRIAEDGEILCRGEMVMKGYWRNEEATRQTVRDGWLHTGDIGEIDPDGHIRITDRKKDIIVNSGGDNISPQRIEGMLVMEPEIGQAMVYGDRRPHLVALLVPDAEWTKAWAREAGKPDDLKKLADDRDFRQALNAVLERVNTDLSLVEKVRRFSVATAPFAIDNGQLTPTMKIRRHAIREVYGEALEGLYG